MKLSNIFKKIAKVSSKQKVQTLDKTQLEKVIGGAETTPTEPVKRPLNYEVWNQPTDVK